MHNLINGVLVPCQHTPSQNHLLDSLSLVGYSHFLPHLKMVQLRKNEILSEPGKCSSVVYFPVNCAISIYHTLKSTLTTEIAMIGNEGMFDITHIMGGMCMPYLVIVQTTGCAFIADSHLFKQELDHDETIKHMFLRYTQALFIQIAQRAVCNKHHSIIQQFCLLLLRVIDKSLSLKLHLTQETIAQMMGVRREGVTEAAGKLRNKNLIDYTRGHITVIDRLGLEKQCCECYVVVKNEFKRLLGY